MTKTERIIYVLSPLGMAIVALLPTGVFNAIFKLNQFGSPEYAMSLLITTLVLIGMMVMAGLVLMVQMLWLVSHNSPMFSQEKWWHLYFGSAAALCGFIMAYATCCATNMANALIGWLTIAAIATGGLARLRDSGIKSSTRAVIEYAALFALTGFIPLALTFILLPFGGIS